jgi:multicomponent Na+:H+ antiporter subunit B
MTQRLLAVWLALIMLAVLSVVAADLPAFGSDTAPPRNETLTRYVGSVREDTGAVNSVTAVVFDYRGYDTLGEATVLFTAAAALAAVLGPMAAGRRDT